MSKTMRAARLHEPGTPFRIDEIPVPEVGPGDALIAVRGCGVCPQYAERRARLRLADAAGTACP